MAVGQHRFKVAMVDFACEDLQVPDKCEPYLKIDFDNFKVFKTDHEVNAKNPEWGFKAGFQYRTRFLEKLAHRRLKVMCYDRQRGSDARPLGEAEVDLQSVACGPSQFRLSLLDPNTGEPKGRVKFLCIMKMLSQNFSVVFEDLKLTMQGSPAPARLSMSSTLAENIVTEVPHSDEGVFPDQYRLSFETTLGDLLQAPDQQGIRIVVVENDVQQGEAMVAFRKYFVPSDDTEIHFLEPVTYSDTTPMPGSAEDSEKSKGAVSGAVGDISGVLKLLQVPVYAQMAGGVYIDSRVEGGQLLFEGLPYPSCFGAVGPPVWSEEVSREEGHQATGGEHGGDFPVDISEEEYMEVLEEIELPPNWQKRHDRRSNRPYFADLRSRKTTWKDPRFLPDNWDQRIDPNTGQVYFAYHKTRQTTFIDPRYCPQGWEMRLSHAGEVYYLHTPAMKTGYTDPRGLPEGFDAALDDRGRVYYKDHHTRSTSWEDPRLSATEAENASWRSEQQTRWWKEQVWSAIELQWRENEEANAREERECTPAPS